jgi:hypothetical protein
MTRPRFMARSRFRRLLGAPQNRPMPPSPPARTPAPVPSAVAVPSTPQHRPGPEERAPDHPENGGGHLRPAEGDVVRPLELAGVFRRIWALKLAMVPIILIALYVGASTGYKVSLSPPELQSRQLGYGIASSTVLLDARRSPLRDISQRIDPLALRARFYAILLMSDRLRADVARRLDVPLEEVAFNAGRANDPADRAQALGPEVRANALIFEGARFRFLVEAQGGLPLVDIDALARTDTDAARGAEAAADALVAEVGRRQRAVAQTEDEADTLVAQKLGEPSGSQVTPGMDLPLSIGIGFLTLVGLTVLLLAVANLLQGLRRRSRTTTSAARRAA